MTQNSRLLSSFFQLEVTARPGRSAEEIEKAINAELEKFRGEGPTEKELERARNQIERQIVFGLETLGGFGGVADRLNQYNHYLGTPDYLAQDIQRYRNAMTASVKQFAQEQLAPNQRAVVYAVPGTQKLASEVPTAKADPNAPKGGEGINAEEAWRKEMPKPAAARALSLPTPTSFQLANGLTVIYNERVGLPTVAASLVVRTGSDANPADKPGLANFTAAMLDEGTATRSALEIADEAAQLGATLNTGSSMDATTVTASALKKNFPATLGLLADVALHPSFPQAEIERQKASRLAQVVQRRQNPGIVSSQVLAAALYGWKHPYGYPEIGTEEAIKGAVRDDMVAFWKQNFVPNNAALIVTGNISEAELRKLAEKEFGSWQKGTPVKPALGAPATTSAKLVLVDKPGAQQTYVRVGRVGVSRSTPDYAPLEVMNGTLGGLFSSRINLNLREDKGYTYGAGSFFLYRKGAGPFQVVAPVRTDVTAPAVGEIFKELKRMAETPMTAEELRLSVDSQVRSLPGLFETSTNAANSYANIYLYDLGLDYYTQLPAKLGAVNAEAAQAVAKKYLVSDQMVVVAVGDRAKIEPELAKMNLAPVELRDSDGKLQK